MTDKSVEAEDRLFTKRVIDAGIKVLAIWLILTWCYDIIKPFLIPIMWGAILAIALYPVTKKLGKLLGGRNGLAATFIALIGISILVIPAVKFSEAGLDTMQTLKTKIETDSLEIPPPAEKVKEWPVIGEKTHALWSDASKDVTAFLQKYPEQIKGTANKVLGGVASAGGTIMQFIISLIIAAVFMTHATPCQRASERFFTRLMNERGVDTVASSISTVRSVAQGVIGIALTQAILASIGLAFADIPAVGIWTLLVLMVAIIQLPPIIILGPISAYYFSVAETTPAVIFLVWNIVVSSSDAFLKPLLLGRGTDTPMLVILIGAIGGMITAGIIGLFIGAVTLALGYQLLLDWLEQAPDMNDE